MGLKKLKGILENYDIFLEKENYGIFYNAITHGSYVNQSKKNIESYQRLEFLGDSVIELVTSEHLYNSLIKIDEGSLTHIRAKLVKTQTLAELSIKLEFNKCLFLSQGEINDNGEFKQKIAADVYESIVGAIYMTMGFEVTKKFILDTLIKNFFSKETAFEDIKSPKSILQEKIGANNIKYVLDNEKIFDSNQHIFFVSVVIDDVVYGSGTGSTKKEAESQAAKEALNKLSV